MRQFLGNEDYADRLESDDEVRVKYGVELNDENKFIIMRSVWRSGYFGGELLYSETVAMFTADKLAHFLSAIGHARSQFSRRIR